MVCTTVRTSVFFISLRLLNGIHRSLGISCKVHGLIEPFACRFPSESSMMSLSSRMVGCVMCSAGTENGTPMGSKRDIFKEFCVT